MKNFGFSDYFNPLDSEGVFSMKKEIAQKEHYDQMGQIYTLFVESGQGYLIPVSEYANNTATANAANEEYPILKVENLGTFLHGKMENVNFTFFKNESSKFYNPDWNQWMVEESEKSEGGSYFPIVESTH